MSTISEKPNTKRHYRWPVGVGCQGAYRVGAATGTGENETLWGPIQFSPWACMVIGDGDDGLYSWDEEPEDQGASDETD